MSFYEELSKVYDIVFPVEEETVNFLIKNTKKPSQVLDIACGTGSYSSAIAKKGYAVDGVDIDPNMVKIAEKKIGALNLNLKVGDMGDIKELFPDKKYDLIYCIGNSLVHLESREAIDKLVRDIYSMLNKDGRIIIQIVNYERIKKYKVSSLPTIENTEEGIKFLRDYKNINEEEQIEFETDLAIKDDLIIKHYYNRISLIPLKGNELKDMLEKAGFSDIEIHQDFNDVTYSPDSYYAVFQGIRKS